MQRFPRTGRAIKEARGRASGKTMDFPRIKRLPPYVFNAIGELCLQARRAGEDIIDFGMGNPDEPTPPHIVGKLIEAASKPANHRYSVSRGVYKLRGAICDWYKRRYGAEFDPDSEAIVTIGSKEGIGHMMLAILDQGDVVIAPTPTYPIHQYGSVIAGAQVQGVPLHSGEFFFDELLAVVNRCWPRPKLLIMNFPHNPTTATVNLSFMKRMVEFARENGILVVHDFAYADLCFDGYRAPSIMEVPGAREVAVEFFTLSKSYNMPGWRVGFAVGNREMIAALGGSSRTSIMGCSHRCRSRRLRRSTGRSIASAKSSRRIGGGATLYATGSICRAG